MAGRRRERDVNETKNLGVAFDSTVKNEKTKGRILEGKNFKLY
jgi:hypothetical protein